MDFPSVMLYVNVEAEVGLELFLTCQGTIGTYFLIILQHSASSSCLARHLSVDLVSSFASQCHKIISHAVWRSITTHLV